MESQFHPAATNQGQSYVGSTDTYPGRGVVMVSTIGARAEDELELTDYLRILRRRWIWVAAIVSVVLALAFVVTVTRHQSYTSTAQVSVGNSAAQDAIQSGARNAASSTRVLSNEVNLAASDSVRSQVESQLGLVPKVKIAAAEAADAIDFTGTGPTADDAAAYANTWAQVYVEVKRQQAADSITGAIDAFEADLAKLRTQRQDLRQPIDDLEDKVSGTDNTAQKAVLQGQLTRLQGDLEPELDLIDARVQAVAQNITNLQLNSRLAASGTAQIVQVAAPPQVPTNAPLSRNLVLAMVVGLILGAAAALLAENLDRTIKGPDDLAALGVPILGLIPDPGRHLSAAELPLATMRHPGSAPAEAYQKVRTAVEFTLLGRHISSLLITSPNQAEGKTTLATNLAWAMSAVDHRVALIDVDFRRPRIHEVFGCDPEPGLSDNLRSGMPLSEMAVRVGEPGTRNLVVIPTGSLPPNPSDFVASPGFTAVIRDLEAEADLVILDAPPVGPVSDALSIGRDVDAVIVVVRARSTTRENLIDTLDSLRQVGADVIGICLVGIRQQSGDYGRYERREQPPTGLSRRRNQTQPDDPAAAGQVLDLRRPPSTRRTPPAPMARRA